MGRSSLCHWGTILSLLCSGRSAVSTFSTCWQHMLLALPLSTVWRACSGPERDACTRKNRGRRGRNKHPARLTAGRRGIVWAASVPTARAAACKSALPACSGDILWLTGWRRRLSRTYSATCSTAIHGRRWVCCIFFVCLLAGQRGRKTSRASLPDPTTSGHFSSETRRASRGHAPSSLLVCAVFLFARAAARTACAQYRYAAARQDARTGIMTNLTHLHLLLCHFACLFPHSTTFLHTGQGRGLQGGLQAGCAPLPAPIRIDALAFAPAIIKTPCAT